MELKQVLKLINITSIIPVLCVCLGVVLIALGGTITMIVGGEYFSYSFMAAGIMLAISVPLTLTCLAISYWSRVISLGNLLISLFFTLVSGGLYYLALVFTLRNDVKTYIEYVRKNKDDNENADF